MTTPHPDSVVTLVDYGERKYPNAFIKIWCSLDDLEFDDALENILEKIIDDIEKDVNHLSPLLEDAITAVLVIAINAIPGLRGVQQAHSNGHVDITIEGEINPPLRRRLGEAKIYDGPKYHEKGLEQLVKRYTTGREGQGILIEYVKDPNIKQLVEKIRRHMDANKPCAQSGTTQDHRIHWAFTSNHFHSSGELIRVVHFSCNLFRGNIVPK